MQSSFYSRLHLEVDGARFSNYHGIKTNQLRRINFKDRGKVLALSEEGYSQSQEGSPGVCMIAQGLDS